MPRSLDARLLFQVLSPLAWWVPVVVLSRRKGWSLRDDLAVRRPAGRVAATWLAAFVAYFVAGEYLNHRFGLTETTSWIGRFDTTVIVVRAVAIILVAPLSEEIFFRGVLFRLLRGRLRPVLIVGVAAAAFAPLHFQYDAVGMTFVFADALFYGWARQSSGSVLLPMLLHVLNNSYAAWERIFL